MEEIFKNDKLLVSDWQECDGCKQYFETIIYVDETDKSLCFGCHRTRYGFARFMRIYKKMSKEHQEQGWNARI